MSKKQLPLSEPPIKGLHYLANPLAILFNDKDVLPWFYSEYVQLIWYVDEKFLSFNGKYISEIPTSIPWLEFQCMDKKFIKGIIDIQDFLVDAIDSGWYIISSYDEFYIPNTRSYQKNHFNHDFMIYGYDLCKKEYIMNIYTSRMKLESNFVPFDCFNEAFFANESDDFEFNRINLYRKKEFFSYDFDKQLLIEQLCDYVHSTCSNRRYLVPYGHDKRIFGIDIYSYIISIFKEQDNSAFDLRILYLLWEHKKCMRMRIDYMVENDLLIIDRAVHETFNEIEKIASKVRILQLKLHATKNMHICNRIVDHLEILYVKEKGAIEVLLKALT